MPIDYQIFIASFEEDLIKHLVNRLSIISETVENILRTKNAVSSTSEDDLFYFNKFMQTIKTIIINVASELECFNERKFFKTLTEFSAHKMKLHQLYPKARLNVEQLMLDKNKNIDSLKQIIEKEIKANLAVLKHFTPTIESGKLIYINHINRELGLFYSFKNEIENLLNLNIDLNKEVKALPHQPIIKPKPKLKIDQIALKYAYEGLQITRENGNEIAKEYGHNSGEKLFQRYTYFSSSANRKGKPNLCTPKKLDNKIKLIESIIELLPTDKQQRAIDEASILKRIYEAEYH